MTNGIRNQARYTPPYFFGRAAIVSSLLALIWSCSALKLDKEENCLNEKAACFKWDKTRPSLSQAQNPADYLLSNQTVSTLASVDLQFSEELKEPQIADFVFSGPGAVNGITITSIEKLSNYTYRLHLSASLETGYIYLDFPNLRDYAGNLITGSTRVTYYGNVDIPVPIVSVSHYGVSSSGYPSIAVSWRYNYTPVLPGNTLYTIGLTNGSTDCNGATMVSPVSADVTPDTPVGAGAVVSQYDPANAAGTTHNFTLDTSVITTLGAQVILVCVKNAVNNKRGTAVISVVRDDSAPTTTVSPLAGPYASPRTLTFDCSNNADRVIYSVGSTSGTGVDPVVGSIADPAFNASTGAITSGTQYNAAAKPQTPYTANPTHSIFKYRCIDQAGNIEAIKTTPVYVVDSNFPEVTISRIYKGGSTTREITGLSSQVGAFNTADIVWSTNQVNKPWTLRYNSTNCTDGSVVQTGVTPLSGTTPLTANQPVPMPAQLRHDSTGLVDGPNVLRLCVQNGAQYGQETFTIIRDSTVPVVTPNVPAGNYGAVQSLEFTCSDNAAEVIYSVASADGTAPVTPPSDPTFDVDGVRLSGLTHSGPVATPNQKTTMYKWRCLDKAGNQSASVGSATYVVDSLLPVITITSNTHAILGPLAPQNTTALSWKSSYPSRNYEVRVGGSDCSSGTVIAGPLLTPSDVNVAVNTNIGQAALAEGANTVRICVENFTGLSGMKGFTTQSLTRDSTAPTISNKVATIAAVDATNFTLTIPAASDTGTGIAGYRVYRTDAGSYPTFPILPTYTVTSSPATIQMPDTSKYYLRIVPFDGAGNTPASGWLNYDDLATKPSINIVITGNVGSLMLTDGSQSPVAVASNMAWTTSLGTGQPYTFNITAQPAGQVCAIKEKQFGTLSSDLTININCVNGQMVGGRFQSVAASGMNSMLQRTRSDVWVSTFAIGGELPNSVAVAGGFVFFGTDGDCDAGAPVRYCIYKRDVNSAGSPTLVVNNIPGIVRGIATDGTNLYYGTLSDNRLYKVPLAGGTPAEITSGLANPFAIALEGADAYICNRAANEIVKVDLLTGGKTSIVSGVAAPLGLTIAGANLYFTLYGTHAIFRVPKTGGTVTTVYGAAGTPAETDGNTTAARFNEPHDLTYDGKDNLFVADYSGHTVRRIRISTGRVTTIVGDSSISSMTYSNGVGPTAKLPRPVGVTTDGRNLFVSLHGDRRIIKLTEQKLTGHWPLAGATDDYGSDGIAVAGTWSGAAAYGTGRFGEANGAALFDGSKYITTKDIAITVNQPFTLAAWVNVGDYGLSRPIFGNMSNYEFHLYVGTNGSVNFQNWHSSGALSNYLAGTSAGVIKPNTWVHVAYVFRNNSGPQPGGRIFINGHDMTVSSTLANSGALDSFATSVTIGAALSFASKFVGSIADARIYNRNLTDAEINELAQDASSIVVGSSFNTGATELLSYFPIDSLTGNDYGPAGLNLSNSSASPVNGIDGDYPGAVDLQGTTGSNLNVGSAAGLPRLDAPRSFCAFVRPTAQPAAGIRYPIVSYGGTTANFQGAELVYFNQSGTDYRVGMTKIGDSVDAQIKLPIFSWSHVCGTNDGAVSRLYVNGVELPATGSNAQVFSSTAGVLKVGTRVYDPSNTFAFKGNVDEVRIYNKALSAAEIRQLSAIVPAGLIARYDFEGDTQDVSGFGNGITNAGATPTDDRYGLNSRAYKFGGTSGMQVSAVQAVTSNITLALWIQPATLPGSLTGLLDNWNGDGSNTGASGGGLILNGNTIDVMTRGGGSGGALPSIVDCSSGFKPPIGAYSHIAATVSFTGTTRNISLYVNGGLVKTCSVATTAPPVFNNGVNFYLAKNVWPSSFDGNIDDVRIYNRALTQTEIQQLVQQPNKRIYVTNTAYTGNLGGIAGADAKCNAADANKPAGAGTFKALLVDAASTSLRRACTSGNCLTGGVGEHIDWVLRPNITYLQRIGETAIFTANWQGVHKFDPGSFLAPIDAGAFQAWTGIGFAAGSHWVIDGGPGQCTGGPGGPGWSGSTANGVYGMSSHVTQDSTPPTTGAMYVGWEAGCTTPRRLYCVEQ